MFLKLYQKLSNNLDTVNKNQVCSHENARFISNLNKHKPTNES
jgi:hypothetical protein